MKVIVVIALAVVLLFALRERKEDGGDRAPKAGPKGRE
jgi:hypothetical protein